MAENANEIEKKFISAGLVDVSTIDPTIQVDLLDVDGGITTTEIGTDLDIEKHLVTGKWLLRAGVVAGVIIGRVVGAIETLQRGYRRHIAINVTAARFKRNRLPSNIHDIAGTRRARQEQNTIPR